MHIHVPKPLHGWKAFFNEIFVIVIGVLIALGFEQVVEEAHWAHKVADGKERLQLELGRFYIGAAMQIAQGPCRMAQYDLLERGVLASGSALAPATVAPPARRVAYLGNAAGAVEFSQGRILTPIVYQSLSGDGTLLRLPGRDQRRIGAIYAQAAILQENAAAARAPRVLALPVPLSPETRFALVDEIEKARSAFVRVSAASVQVASWIEQLGMAPPPAEARSLIADELRQVAPACAAMHAPLIDWRPVVAGQPSLEQMGL